VVDFIAAKARGRYHELWQIDSCAAVLFHIVRDNYEISRDPFPNVCIGCRRAQILEVNGGRIRKLRSIDDVAQPEIEMAVHTLKRGNHHTIRNRRNSKCVIANQTQSGTMREPRGNCYLLSSLSQTAHVNLDCLGKSGNRKVPFSR